MLCGEGSLVQQDADAVHAVSLKCRAWTCDACQPDRQRQLKAKAFAGVPTLFLTLTVNPAWGRSPEDRAKALTQSWAKIAKRAKARYGYKRLPYLWVFEATKRGEPHLHILARAPWIDQRWLSAQMRELMNAPVVDVRRADNPGRVSSYVCKYVGKEPMRFGSNKRYFATRDWELEDYEPEPAPLAIDGAWLLDSAPLHCLRRQYEDGGYRCWIARGHLWGTSSDPPWW